MLIDTSGWFCMIDSRESQHSQAVAIYSSRHRFITHSYILAELVALAEIRRSHRQNMLLFVERLLEDAEIEMIWADENVTRRALDLLNSRKDKSWSLCDAVSFMLMSDLGENEALTTDHHFEQAGFVRLLES